MSILKTATWLSSLFLVVGWATPLVAQTPMNQVVMEVFIRGDSERSEQAANFANELAKRRTGLKIKVHDVLIDQAQLSRLWKLAKEGGRDKPVVPMFYSCNRLYFGYAGEEKSGPAIEDLLTAHVYTRDTCPKCRSAKAFIRRQVQPQWPAIRFQIYEITYDADARRRYGELCRSRGRTPGLPTIHFASHVLIGYQGDHISGVELESLIHRVSDRGSSETSVPRANDQSMSVPTDSSRTALMDPTTTGIELLALVAARSSRIHVIPGLHLWLQQPAASADEFIPNSSRALETRPPPDASEPNADVSSGFGLDENSQELESAGLTEDETDELPFDDVPLPMEAGELETGESELIVDEAASDSETDTIDLPFLGQFSAGEMGLPLFTFVVGLIDGFNPCAMWILVFLLSVLVNIKDRRKILLIAGTFVFVSGLAYFAFMAAWLNVFMLIGIARPAQVILGLLAIIIGVVNVKDFFAFKKGVSFSIPESAKPGLYRRVREIVSAQYLTAALGGVIVLAVVVNMVELLCTAGLPALYTQILTMQDLPTWKNYAYLALYILAYMLDDTILFAIVVATLSHRRLQEREGRWLKLVSGVVILALGLVMILRPEWLQLGH